MSNEPNPLLGVWRVVLEHGETVPVEVKAHGEHFEAQIQGDLFNGEFPLGTTPHQAVQIMARHSQYREAVPPGELTRAELEAELATLRAKLTKTEADLTDLQDTVRAHIEAARKTPGSAEAGATLMSTLMRLATLTKALSS